MSFLSMTSLRAGSAVLFASLAALSDLRTGKIPNILSLTAWAVALPMHYLLVGPRGPLSSLFGGILPLLALAPLFRFGMIGAGDLKILSALGAIFGWPASWHLFVATILVGGLLSLLLLIARNNARERFTYFVRYLQDARTGQIRPYRTGLPKNATFPLTVPIWISTLLIIGGFPWHLW